MKTAPTTLRARLALTLANFAEKIALPGILKRAPRTLSGVDESRGWFSLFSSGRHLGFQTDTQVESHDSLLAQTTIFSCITLIAADIGKMRAKLVEQVGGVGGIWQEVMSPAFSPVLRKPNHFQTWQLFVEQWAISLLTRGNAYVLKVRDARRVVVALYVLDPVMVRPLVAGNGDVFYSVQQDDLSQVFEAFDGPTALPASEIIHDRVNCFFHPLVGLSPLFASSLAASKALKADSNAARFFANQSQPGGVLSGPGEISDATAARLKEYFEQNFSGNNAGKLAVLGDNLKFEKLTTNAVDSQLVEQLELSAKQVAAAFRVPAHMVGASDVPPNNNVEALQLQYFGQCIQQYIEHIENALDDGLALGKMTDGRTLGIELDLEGLLRMDSKSLADVESTKVQRGISTINEARRRFNAPPVDGGDTPMLQEQNWPLALLANRDVPTDAPASPAPTGSSAAKRLRVRASAPVLDGAMWRVSKAIGGEIRTHHFAEESAAKAWAAEDDETEGLVIDGLSFADVKAIVDQAVEKAMTVAAAALPAPKDGAAGASAFELAQARGFDGSLDRWLESLKGERGDRGEKGDAGPVGLQGPEGLPGRDGRDGQQGEPGRDAFAIEVAHGIDERLRYSRGTVAAYRGGLIRAVLQTAPLKSVDGDLARAGWQVILDGIHTDKEETLDDGRHICRTTEYTSGRKVVTSRKTWAPVYRDMWKADNSYHRGDAVTFAGSLWFARRDVSESPTKAPDAWRLAVKRGAEGRPGRDANQLVVVSDKGDILEVRDGQA